MGVTIKRQLKKRVGKLLPVSDTLDQMIQGKGGFSDSYKRWQVYLNWRDLVGDIADYSTPVAYNCGVLFISVEHSAYLQQLEFLKEQIKDKVNNFEKNWVKSIRLQLRQH